MKMKEKKTEEVVEETPKVSDELRRYLEHARQNRHQLFYYFNEVGCKDKTNCTDDSVLESFGVKTSFPVNVWVCISKDDLLEHFEDFVAAWIEEYNELDVSKFDNYTKLVVNHYAPDILLISQIRKLIKKCAQHITEE